MFQFLTSVPRDLLLLTADGLLATDNQELLKDFAEFPQEFLDVRLRRVLNRYRERYSHLELYRSGLTRQNSSSRNAVRRTFCRITKVYAAVIVGI